MRLKRILRWVIFSAIALTGIVIATILLIQIFWSQFLQDYVRTELGWTLKIGAAQIQFHPLTIRLENIELSAEHQKPFLQAKSAYASLPYSSLWKEEFFAEQIIIDSPKIDFEMIPSRKSSTIEAQKKFRIAKVIVRDGQVQYKNYELRQIDLDSEINSDKILIRKLKSKFKEIILEADGTVKNSDLNLSYQLVGDTADIVSLLSNEQEFRGKFVSKGSVKGELKRPIISGQVECRNLILQDSNPFALEGRYRYNFQNDTDPISLELNFNSIALQVVRYYWQDMPQFDAIGSGTLHYSGSTDVWKSNGKIEIQIEPSENARRPLAGAINGRFQNGLFQIDESNLLLKNSRFAAKGTLSRNQLSINADVQSSNLRDLTFLYPQLAYAPGNYHVQATLAGSYEDIHVQGELIGQSKDSMIKATGSTRLGSRVISLEFQGNAGTEALQKFFPDLKQGGVQFEGSIGGKWENPIMQIHALSPDLQLQADGSYQLNNGTYHVIGSINEAPIEAYLAFLGKEQIPINGNIQGNFEASGNVSRWRDSTATMQLAAPEMKWKDVLVSVPEAQFKLEKRVVHINSHLQSPNVQLNASGNASLQPSIPLQMQIKGKIDGAVLEKFSSDWKGDGQLNIDAAISGTGSHPKLAGKFLTENFNLNYAPKEWNIALQKAELNLSEHELALEGNGKLNNSPFVCNAILPLQNSDGNLHLKISDFPINAFSSDAKISGTVNVNADLEGKGFPLSEWRNAQAQFREWAGNVSITPSNLKLGNNILTVQQPIHLTIQNQQVHLSPTRIQSGDLLNFEGTGNLNLKTGQIDSAVQLEARIDLLSNLKADIQSSGPLKADLRLFGTVQNPEYEGMIVLNQASLRIPESPVAFEQLDLQASLKNKRLQLQKLEARSGGGTITGGGELILGSKGSEVWFKGKNVAANYPEGLRSQIDFDLKLSSIESNILLSGDVKVLRSFYEQQFNLRNPIIRKLMAATTELTAEKRLKNRLKLDVNISTVRDLRLKNNVASVTAGGDLKVEGSVYKPKLSGQLHIRPGSKVYLAGNQYDVEKATVEFLGGDFIDPHLDITLYTLQRDFQTDTYYEVFLPFGGPLSNIEFKTVRSIPSLSQDQIFSLITQGTVESEHVSSSRAIFQRQILSTIAAQVIGAPGTAIAKSIGLSRMQVQQEGLTSVNDPKTRLMLGKDIGSGFSLIYSFVLNDPQDQTWIASYRYGRNIIGRFIDQDDGTYTVSASHRIPFGPGASPSDGYYASRKRERKPGIDSVQIKNDSPLTEKQIQHVLKVEPGDEYDYWDLQDRVDELKKELQKMDFLDSTVDVHEKENEKGSVSLEIDIHVAERAQMIFAGYEVGEKLLKNYNRMWRTGISPFVVQQMIQEDLLRQIQLTGCYKASVKVRTEKSETRIIYYFDADPGPKFSTVELKFHGAEHYDPQILQADLLKLYPSSASLFREAIQKPSDFSEKIKMLYAQKGYLRTVIEPGSADYSTSSDKIVRSINIDEGPISYIDTVKISKGESIPDTLQAQIQLASGKPFLPDALLDDEIKIQDFYESQGYQHVSVQYNVQFSNGSTDLKLYWSVDARPIAKIASIRIEGNQSTREELIRKQIGLKEGDLLTQANRSLARKRLSDLGIFQQVGIETEETDVPGSYDVVIRVVETKKYEFQYGGRYNTDDNFGAEIRLTDFNFLGRAQNLSLYLRSTLDLPLFRIDYMLPVVGNFWDRMRLSIFRDETDEDVRATISGDLVKIPFTKKQLTFQYQQDHRLWNFYRLFWGFQYGSFTADFEDLQDRAPRQFQGTEALFHAAFLADRRDDSLNASTGYFYSLDGEYAPKLIGTDISYAKTFSQLFYYKKLGKIVSASGIRLGFLSIRSNVLTFAEKFRTGGSTTMRGFVYNTVVPGEDALSIFFGGDSVLILNEELRFPIHKWFSGATFVDIGNVYRNISDFNPTDLRYSAGLGMRIGTGSFLLRFDLGFNLDPEEDESRAVFHFGIGQAF
jgi:outer membrane protein assembly complex protein YaeT